MSIPPCVLSSDHALGSAQTFVVNTTGCPADLLTEYGARAVVNGDGAFARVRLQSDEHLLILSLARPCKVENAVHRLKTSISALPGAPAVSWIRPLNRRLQRLFGWVYVAAATGVAGDTEELAVPESTGRPRCAWRQHPTVPLPFFVRDYTKWPEEEKLAWLRQELGGSADLPDFAQLWMELFADTKRGTVPQKASCLKLFGDYSGSAWRKECDLPPDEFTAFQRIWDPAAPERCSECSRGAPPLGRFPLHRVGRPFCSEACAQAGKHLACRGCGGPVDAVYPRCSDCNWGLEPKPAAKGGAIQDVLERNELALCSLLRIVRSVNRVDDAHEAAWKKRRRA
jgi:hypothetical protein